MPVIAESPPLVISTVPSGTPVPPPVISIPPPPAVCDLSEIYSNHELFIKHVDSLGACFKREAFPQFTDNSFDFHINLAMVDKYLTKSDDMYCSMQAVENLSHKLKRFQD